jgi:hypothetical protein
MGINCGEAPGNAGEVTEVPRSYCEFYSGIFKCMAYHSLNLRGGLYG